MARRRLLGDEQWAALFALPAGERDVVRHCTLTPDDLALVAAKRSAPNRLAYALLLCALRHPGRALEPGERPPAPMVAFVARQLGIDPAVLATGPDRPQTRREQLVELMRRGGFQGFGRAEARDLVTWLTPVTQANRKPGQLAGLLVEELRRRRILLPTPMVLELVIHHARIRAERALHRALIDGMGPVQLAALDELLAVPADSAGPSPIAWLRQPPGSPAARNLVGLVERVRTVRAIGLDWNCEAAVPPAAFDALAGEGLRMTAQHLRDLAQPRRAATLAATVLRLDTELTDAALLMFDKLMGGLSRRAERKAVDNAAAALRDAQRHLRLLARAGRALIAAREDGTDASEAVESAVGWGPFLRAVAEAEQIARPETVDVRAELVQQWPAMRQFAPALLKAFAFEGTASASGLLKAVSLLRDTNQAGKRTLPGNAPLGFIRRGWRPFVVDAGGKVNRRAWEVCVLSELRDRLRAGDVWVRGSRRYRNFEDCLLPKPTFAALRAEGPLPVAVEQNVERHLATRCDALAAAMEDVVVLAKAGQLPDAVLDETGLRITPLRAKTPPEALRVAQDAYGMLPRPRITDLLLEVDGWTKFSDCFTHQRSGRPVEERAALLTTVLADGINLGLSAESDAKRPVIPMESGH